jgi:hypothetical protein
MRVWKLLTEVCSFYPQNKVFFISSMNFRISCYYVREYSNGIHRVSQEERSVFCEVIVSDILSKYVCIYIYVLFRTVSEVELFHCTDEQHAMSSHELQSALMLTVEFSKMYCAT